MQSVHAGVPTAVATADAAAQVEPKSLSRFSPSPTMFTRDPVLLRFTRCPFSTSNSPDPPPPPPPPPPPLPPPPHPPHFTTRAQVNPSLSECGSQVAAAHVDSSTGMQHALGRRSTAAANRRDR